jgi:sugar/nucleoside kinase (ribokinase family)
MAHVLDFLAVGTITRDLLGNGKTTIGGTVTYAAATACGLGMRTGIIARADPQFDLSPLRERGIEILRLPAQETTTFANLYRDGRRLQYISAVAGAISPADIPDEWRTARIVHLGPLAQDLPASVACAFDQALIGVTPQGWMRQWGSDGLIHAVPWAQPEDVLSCSDVLVFSVDDVAGDERLIHHYGSLVETMVVTQSRRGATVYRRGQRPHHFPAFTANEVDPTGAGDVFCAAYLIHLAETGDPYASCRFANCVASFSVEGLGISTVPTRAQVEERLRQRAIA